MKKRLYKIICSLTLLFALTLAISTPAKAALQQPDFQIVSEYIEQFEDGAYLHVIISEDVTASNSRSTQSKCGSNKTTYYDADGTALWVFTLHGSFQYTPGVSASCTSSSYSINIYDDNWENTAASAYKSGNQAIGDATFKEKILFITTETENVHTTLSCDSYGNLY